MVVQYMKYGSISKFRTLILFSFALYMLSAYYLIILPLPNPDTLKDATGPFMQLIPFGFIHDFIIQTTLNIKDFHTYLPALKQSVVIQPFFNLLITVPFGIYLGYYFKKDFKKTLFLTFLLSLLFELTQLSALYGIYPKPYRLFDVDDLMLNTLGGIIGFFIYKHFLVFLPTREEIDKKNLKRSQKVGYIRRIFAFGIDYYITLFIAGIIMRFAGIELSALMFNVILFGYLTISHLLFKHTIGKALVHIKLETEKNRSYFVAIISRYLMLFLIFSLVGIVNYFFEHSYTNGIFAIIELGILLLLFIDALLGLGRGKTLFYEKISKTKNVNTKRK